jgi:hypothetical protein
LHIEKKEIPKARNVKKLGLVNSWRSMQIIKDRNLWKGLILFLIFFLALSSVQFATPGMVGNDGYYHIKIAYLMRTEGLKPAFDYLPLSVLNSEEYVDHHYMFHLLMIPFTFGDLGIGAKLASIFFPTITFTSIWWMLQKREVEFASLWSLGLLVVSEAFLYRMNMPRAQSLSLLVLVFALHSMLEKKHWPLVLLGFLYVWSYNAFPLLIIVAFAYIVAYWIENRVLRIQPLVYSTAGVVLGLVINPYFPKNLAFIYRHLAPKLIDATAVSVGSEWFPYKTTTLVENSGIALLVFFLGVLALGLNEKKMNVATTTSLFLVIAFGFMLFQSRRFIEYAPPFMLVFTAFAWSPVVTKWKEKSDKLRSESSGRIQLKADGNTILLVSVITLVMASFFWLNLSSSRKVLQGNAKPYQRFAKASTWLRNNTPAKSRVFQTDWDDFPQLFFYNNHNTYTIGLDPTYMLLFDEELYNLWVDITEGEVENPSNEIMAHFEGQYVLTDLKHDDFIREAEEDPDLVLVYQDEFAKIFQVLQ